MKNTIASLLIILSTQFNFAQIATIQDSDGYTNVRKSENSKSEIIHKIHLGEVFWYDYESIGQDKQWIPVYIPQKKSEYDLEGYIHKSRLLILKEATEYSGKDFYFHYHLSSFDLTNRELVKSDGKWITTIDGHSPWGIDGDLPTIQIDSINVTIDGKNLTVEKHYFQNIFEVTNDFKVIKTGQYFIVYQTNSDGAGAYDLAWVFDKSGLKQKLVGTMF